MELLLVMQKTVVILVLAVLLTGCSDSPNNPSAPGPYSSSVPTLREACSHLRVDVPYIAVARAIIIPTSEYNGSCYLTLRARHTRGTDGGSVRDCNFETRGLPPEGWELIGAYSFHGFSCRGYYRPRFEFRLN